MLKRVGADKVVFPSRMQGERLGLELVRPNLIERLELDNQTGIDEITVPEEFIGRSLRDLNLRKNYLVNVLAAGPAEELTVNPPAKYILERGNILVVMGKTVDLQKLPQIINSFFRIICSQNICTITNKFSANCGSKSSNADNCKSEGFIFSLLRPLPPISHNTTQSILNVKISPRIANSLLSIYSTLIKGLPKCT